MNTPPRVIAVDFDDVTADFNSAFAEYNNTLYGSKVQYNDITNFDMSAVYGIPMPILMDRVRDFCHNHHDTIKPNEDLLAAFKILQERGFELQIVTNRCTSLRETTLDWIDKQAPNLFSNTHFANGFSLRNTGEKRSKLSICREINAVLLVDDALSHATEVTDGGIPVLLPNRPWNQTTEGNFVRVSNGRELVSWTIENL